MLDSDMQFHVQTKGAQPLVFEPRTNVARPTFDEATIIEAYCQHSTFFWSEAHADEYRAHGSHIDGVLLTLEQSTWKTPYVHGAAFGFDGYR